MSAERNQTSSHCRVVRLKGDPGKVDEALKLWNGELLPVLKKQTGFMGATLVANRKTGEGLSVSYWETEKAMKGASGQVRPEALKALGKTGGSVVEDDECEVAVLERFKPPKTGAWVRVTTVHGDPAKAAEGISTFKAKVVPALEKQPGSRGAFSFVNRQTGKSFAGSIWDTEQDLQRSEASVTQLREETIKTIAGKGAKVEAFEVVFTEILAPATLGR